VKLCFQLELLAVEMLVIETLQGFQQVVLQLLSFPEVVPQLPSF